MGGVRARLPGMKKKEERRKGKHPLGRWGPPKARVRLRGQVRTLGTPGPKTKKEWMLRGKKGKFSYSNYSRVVRNWK